MADDEMTTTEMWREVRRGGQAKRASNRSASASVLSEAGVSFVEKNDGAHLVIEKSDGRVADFWPGTGLWRVRGSSQRHRGVLRLLRWLGKEARS